MPFEKLTVTELDFSSLEIQFSLDQKEPHSIASGHQNTQK